MTLASLTKMRIEESSGGSDGKETTCNAGDLGSIPGLGRSLGWEDPLEKGTATHSSFLAWRIPWIEEPGVTKRRT